ncbi:hypothetical protein DM02DRAFT_677642 [Periconia macrospinosa]|uniref:Class II aldolase/adducin N-terminal domain-containing protein n=1 Tax=Periconia macrospinosa TaxID=97972 RepID=A0A2V1D2J5_9PLEO|nr:hypothetical protein DM02DRAFT_677642 [Periconia macrospinosa]
MVAANLTQLFVTFINGLHILDYNKLLDAHGHLSVRNRNNATTFFMSRHKAPALVTSPSDIVEYYVANASAVKLNPPGGFFVVPVFDISQCYHNSDTQDLHVRIIPLGAALASRFSAGNSTESLPHYLVVLMQSHGFTTCSIDIETVVFQASYSQIDAEVQFDALAIHHAFLDSNSNHREGLVYLTQKQSTDSWATEKWTVQRPWDFWVREVKVSPLYVN